MFGSDDGIKYKVFGVFVTRVVELPNFKQCEVILLKGEKKRAMAGRGSRNYRECCNTKRLQKNSSACKTWMAKVFRG